MSSAIWQKGSLSREKLVEKIGKLNVEKLDRQNCEPTSRAMPAGCDLTEWSASITVNGPDGYPAVATVYYYTTPADATRVEESGGDWGVIDWDEALSGYEYY